MAFKYHTDAAIHGIACNKDATKVASDRFLPDWVSCYLRVAVSSGVMQSDSCCLAGCHAITTMALCPLQIRSLVCPQQPNVGHGHSLTLRCWGETRRASRASMRESETRCERRPSVDTRPAPLTPCTMLRCRPAAAADNAQQGAQGVKSITYHAFNKHHLPTCFAVQHSTDKIQLCTSTQ